MKEFKRFSIDNFFWIENGSGSCLWSIGCVDSERVDNRYAEAEILEGDESWKQRWSLDLCRVDCRL